LANAFDPVDEAAFQLAGADGIVVKPFDPAELRSRLSALAIEPVRKMAPPVPTAGAVVEDLPETFNTQPMPAEEQVEAPKASEDLSPKAQALADFLSQEVEKNNNTPPELAEAAEPATENSPASIPMPPKEKTRTNIIDLSEALSDWAQQIPANEVAAVHGAPGGDLSEWAQEKTGIFDVGNSSFKFSEDYVERVTKAFIGLSHEESVKKFGVIVSSDRAPQPAVPPAHFPLPPAAAEPVQTTQSIQPTQPISAPTKAAQTNTVAISKEEIEVVLRDEVRRLVREMFPTIAEKVVREELAKALKAIEETSGN
jgi:CheY-like chemotaxis protein